MRHNRQSMVEQYMLNKILGFKSITTQADEILKTYHRGVGHGKLKWGFVATVQNIGLSAVGECCAQLSSLRMSLCERRMERKFITIFIGLEAFINGERLLPRN